MTKVRIGVHGGKIYTLHRYIFKCMRIVYIMVQTCKCIGNVHTMAQDHKNYRPLDIAITASSMIYHLGHVARHDQNQLAHQNGVSKSLEIRKLTSMCVIFLYLSRQRQPD